MKSWEEKRRLKAHKKKLRNIKSTINTGKMKKSQSLKRTQMKMFKYQSQDHESSDVLSTTSIDNSYNLNKSQLSEYTDFEKQDLQSIPLYRLLKLYNLQQYAKVLKDQLITRGFGYKIEKLCRLNRNELNELMLQIRVMPGHKITSEPFFF